MTDSSLTELMTAGQVAELLQMKRSTVEDYARRGLLPSIKLGRHRRFVRSDIEDALTRLRAESGAHVSPTLLRSSGHIRDTEPESVRLQKRRNPSFPAGS